MHRRIFIRYEFCRRVAADHIASGAVLRSCVAKHAVSVIVIGRFQELTHKEQTPFQNCLYMQLRSQSKATWFLKNARIHVHKCSSLLQVNNNAASLPTNGTHVTSHMPIGIIWGI